MTKAIRNGEYSIDEVLDATAGFDEKFETACKKTSLPHSADVDKVNDLQMEMHYTYWKEQDWLK